MMRACGRAASGAELDVYLREALAEVMDATPSEGADVVLYGFGRIGRLLTRILIAHAGGGQGLRLRAIVVRKGALKNIVHGINHDTITNDQNLIDNFHNGDRRGRSAVLNMVITETGAAKAVAKALPALAGKLTGSAIRVPTPDVSLAVLNLTTERPGDKDQVNDYLRRVSLHSKLRQQIDYVESPEIVSTDFVGSHRAGIVDGFATIAEGTNQVLYVWYDNEYGYSCQVVRVIETMAGTHPLVLPKRIEVTLNN